MNARQTLEAQRAADNCARIGIPYELAAWMVATWMKRRGIAVTQPNLEAAFSRFFAA